MILSRHPQDKMSINPIEMSEPNNKLILLLMLQLHICICASRMGSLGGNLAKSPRHNSDEKLLKTYLIMQYHP